MKLRYSDYKVIDGDTLRIKWRGLWFYVRILGVDCDEIGGKYNKRALEQKEKLENFMMQWPKPKIVADIGETRCGGQFIKHHDGRFLCRLYVRRWFRVIDYAKWMIKKGLVKRKSRWNTA